MELRDKLGKHTITSQVSGAFVQSVDADAVNALVALGIGKAVAEQAVKKTMSSVKENASLEEIIKQSLKSL